MRHAGRPRVLAAHRLLSRSRMQRTLVVLGLTLVVIGLAWPWLGKLPLGRLPGDIIIDRPSIKLYVPITTMILVSAVLSLLLWLFRR